MRIPYVDLAAQYAEERGELLGIIDRTLAAGRYVGAAAELEAQLARL